MKNDIAKRYVAYICDSYNEAALKRVVKVVRYYNERNLSKLKLIVSGLPLIDFLNVNDIINIGYADYNNYYIINSRVIILDNERQMSKEAIIACLHKGIICLVNQNCKILASLCKESGIGLVYADDKELLAMLEYINKNYDTEELLKMIYNASGYDESDLIKTKSEQIKNHVRDRKHKIKWLIKKCDGSSNSHEKVNFITQNIIDKDTELILKCSEELSFKNKFIEMLLIYKYIKVFINPGVKFYFTSKISISSKVYHMIKSQIKELAITEIYFSTIPENEDIKVLELRSYPSTDNDIISIDDNSIEYVAEQIGMLL